MPDRKLRCQTFCIGDIETCRLDNHPLRPECRNILLRCRVGWPGSSDEPQMAGALPRQPMPQNASDAAKASGDQIASIRTDRDGRGAGGTKQLEPRGENDAAPQRDLSILERTVEDVHERFRLILRRRADRQVDDPTP